MLPRILLSINDAGDANEGSSNGGVCCQMHPIRKVKGHLRLTEFAALLAIVKTYSQNCTASVLRISRATSTAEVARDDDGNENKTRAATTPYVWGVIMRIQIICNKRRNVESRTARG